MPHDLQRAEGRKPRGGSNSRQPSLAQSVCVSAPSAAADGHQSIGGTGRGRGPDRSRVLRVLGFRAVNLDMARSPQHLQRLLASASWSATPIGLEILQAEPPVAHRWPLCHKVHLGGFMSSLCSPRCPTTKRVVQGPRSGTCMLWTTPPMTRAFTQKPRNSESWRR
jgi:hypothetical protein